MTDKGGDAAALQRYEGIYRDLNATSSRAFYLCVLLTLVWAAAAWLWLVPVIVPELAARLPGLAGVAAFATVVFLPFFAFGPLTLLTIDRPYRRAIESLNAAHLFDARRVGSARGVRPRTRSGAAAVTASPAAASLPPSMRVRLLTWAGRYDEARIRLEAFPQASAFDEFERALLLALVDFVETGEASLNDAVSRRERIPAGRERDYATTMLAFERARMERETRRDWIEPLSVAREDLSHVPFRATGMGRQLQGSLIYLLVIASVMAVQIIT